MKMLSVIPVGARFGRLIVLGDAGRGPDESHRLWLCRCDCGTEKAILPSSLRRGKSASCGCVRREVTGARARTHGQSGTPEHRTWKRIRQRCCNPKNPDYPDYGGRGIKMCDRWLESFENFFADMGPRPSARHSIDRKDVDGNYEPDNCRWATLHVQSRNKRNNVWIEYDGKRMVLEDWATETGIPRTTLEQRVWRGWPLDLVVSAPYGYRPKQGATYAAQKHRKPKPR